MSDEASIREMQQMVAECDQFTMDPYRLVNPSVLERRPYRHRDRLAEAMADHDTAAAAADALECSPTQLRRWAKAYDVDYDFSEQSLAARLESMSADDLQGGQA